MHDPALDALSILVVEDEKLTRDSLTRILSLRYPGMPVYSAENGRVGLELYRLYLPRLVVTDINMPQLSGIEMAREIRAESPGAQLIFLSAHSDACYRADAALIGNVDYVLKPIDGRDLLAKIDARLLNAASA